MNNLARRYGVDTDSAAANARSDLAGVMRGDVAALEIRIKTLEARVTEQDEKMSATIRALTVTDNPVLVDTKHADTKRRDEKPIVDTKPHKDTKSRGGRPKKYVGEPWKAEGVSRSTYMRRQKAKAK